MSAQPGTRNSLHALSWLRTVSQEKLKSEERLRSPPVRSVREEIRRSVASQGRIQEGGLRSCLHSRVPGCVGSEGAYFPAATGVQPDRLPAVCAWDSPVKKPAWEADEELRGKTIDADPRG